MDVKRRKTLQKWLLTTLRGIKMSKVLLREYYALCEGGVCQDLLTEAEKRDIKENNAMYLTGLMQQCRSQNGNGRMYIQKMF